MGEKDLKINRKSKEIKRKLPVEKLKEPMDGVSRRTTERWKYRFCQESGVSVVQKEDGFGRSKEIVVDL